MTATLSPTEHAEAVRFGMHDKEILDELEEHADDVAACEAEGCEKGITKLTRLRCRDSGWRTCDEHFVEGRQQAVDFLAHCAAKRSRPTCLGCRHIFPKFSIFDDVYRVVDL